MTAPDDRLATRHRFAPDVAARVAALACLDNWHGPLALVTDWAVVVAVVLAVRSVRGWPHAALYLLVALPVIATRQRALATLMHEAAHGTLARDRRLNRFLGTFPSGYLVGQTYAAYRRSHVRDHHGYFGDPDRDPDLRAHLRTGVYDARSGRAFALRFLVAPVAGTLHLAIWRELVLNRLRGSRRDALAAAATVGYAVAVMGVAAFAVGPGVVLRYWVVPMVVVFPLVNWYIELLEHVPFVRTDPLDIRRSRHRAVGPVSRHFLGIHNEGYHLDHHLSPRIPFWRLPEAHRIRCEDPAYAAVVAETAPTGRGLAWQFADMTRRVDAYASARATRRTAPLRVALDER